MVGAKFNANFFWSPLTDEIDLLGFDKRIQTDLDGVLDLPATEQLELSIPTQNIEIGHMGVTMRESQLEMIFDAAITLTRDELLARFDPHEADQEHTGIESYADTPDVLLPFIEQARPIAPVALAAMMLHGRRHWGDDWHINLDSLKKT